VSREKFGRIVFHRNLRSLLTNVLDTPATLGRHPLSRLVRVSGTRKGPARLS